MYITPVFVSGNYKMGSLKNLTVEDVNRILGFTANCMDDPMKVKNSWGFKVRGIRCGIWDYKGGDRFSFFGPEEIMVELFGEENVE